MRLLKFLVMVALMVATAAFLLALWWLHRPLQVAGGTPAEVEVPAGASARAVADQLVRAGVQAPVVLLTAWFRVSGQARDIKAGYYEVTAGTTPRALLDKLVRGEQALLSVQILEGWNIRDVLAALRASSHLTQDLGTLDSGPDMGPLMAALALPGIHPEGRFFPDTYRVARGAKASSVLREAARAMQERLAEVWAQRAPDLPLRSPDEALILASIVEKETGQDTDRARIAGVFVNRLRIGMRLQTDPTVIYGLGAAFDGNLRRADLGRDTPYNTYTRAGLPPTPIAMPGLASLRAAVQPLRTDALYFVARGDGSSQFSASLEQHNAAVRRYQLQR